MTIQLAAISIPSLNKFGDAMNAAETLATQILIVYENKLPMTGRPTLEQRRAAMLHAVEELNLHAVRGSSGGGGGVGRCMTCGWDNGRHAQACDFNGGGIKR